MNDKIEKLDAAIVREKAAIATRKAKLRELQRQRKKAETERVVALFRKEQFNEDDLAELKRMKSKTKGVVADGETV